MKVRGHLELNSDASGEIRNVFIERVTSSQEQTIVQSLGMAHAGRLIFNRSTGRVKMWTGSQFISLLTVSDDISSQRLDAIIQSLGDLFTSDGQFNVNALSNFNLTYALSTDLLDVLGVIDVAIQNLRDREWSVSDLSDVSGSPVVDQLLKFSGTEWMPTWLQLSDIQDVSVDPADLDALQGISGNIQDQLNEITLLMQRHQHDASVVELEPGVSFNGEILEQSQLVQLAGVFEMTTPLDSMPLTLGTMTSLHPHRSLSAIVPIFVSGEWTSCILEVTSSGQILIRTVLLALDDPSEQADVMVDVTSVMYLSI